MFKWLTYFALAALLVGGWMYHMKVGEDLKHKAELAEIAMSENPETGDKLMSEVTSLEGQRLFMGILLAFVSAGVAGIFFVLEVLPMFAHRLTHVVYDSAEMMEHDVMHDARSLLAQGDHEGAIAAFRAASAADPLNRLPWVEIAKIYRDNLKDPIAAINTLREAVQSHEWEVSDAAYFLFRLAELYDEDLGDRETAVTLMQQVINEFPGTRHSANANHRLQEWQERAYLEQVGEDTRDLTHNEA